MNKSDLLNQIENIGDLKGILYILTRQNMFDGLVCGLNNNYHEL